VWAQDGSGAFLQRFIQVKEMFRCS
jgi:hypothetical protein